MASNEWNSVDNYKLEHKEYYCAFLDILGYKEKSEMYFREKFNLKARFKRALLNTFETIKLINVLVDFSKLEVKFFSDSVILFMPKKNDDNDNLYIILLFCKILSAYLSYEELYVRGGISFGEHEDIYDETYGFSFLSSLALQRAYTLENNKAIYPRVLIDPLLIPILTMDSNTMVVKEKDDYFVHFAPQVINSDGNNVKEVLMEMRDIQLARSKLKEQRIIDKYTWLLNYYYWTLTKCNNVDMDIFSDFNSLEFDDFALFD